MQTLISYDEMPRVVRDFVNYKLTVQGRSKKTADEYALDLRTFFRYLTAKRQGLNPSSLDEDAFAAIDVSGVTLDEIAAVTPSDIYDFLYYTLENRSNQSAARARKLSALKSFYKYLTVSMKLIENDPTKNIEGPQKKPSLPKYLSLEESEALLEAVTNDAESKTRERDFCILTLFLNCGMRLSELVGISLNDIDSNYESLRVLGKGAKERMVYLNDACRDALSRYLPVRAADEVQIKDKNALFLSSRHTRISNKTVQWVVYKYLKLAGLENRHFSTHKLRHTAATLMYQSGEVDVRVLKDILGHEQLNTTQIYTHVSDEHMKQAIASNPLSSYRPDKKSHSNISNPEDEDAEEEESD